MLDMLTRIQAWFKNSSAREKLIAALLVFSLIASGILFVIAEGTDITSDPTTPAPFYIVGVFLQLILVLLLIVISAVVFRRWMHLGPKNGATRQLRLIETVRLSPKQTLYLVAVGDQQLLIGATDQNISLLFPVEGNMPSSIEEVQSSQSLDFGSLVQSFNSNPPSDLPNGRE